MNKLVNRSIVIVVVAAYSCTCCVLADTDRWIIAVGAALGSSGARRASGNRAGW